MLLVVAPCCGTLLCHPAAIHVPDRAAHLPRRVGRQEHGQRAQLVGCHELARGLLFQHQLALGLLDRDAFLLRAGFDLLLHQRRQHPARADRVGGHAGLRGFQRGHLGQADDAVLGCHIGRFLRRRHQPVRRGHVDDAAPVLLAHAGQREARGVEGGSQVDGDDRVPALDGKVLDRRHMLDAGIVDQDVGAAEVGLRIAHHVLDLCRLAHVRAVVADLDALAGLRDLVLCGVHITKAIDDDIGALSRQRLCDAEPDTAGRAGHQSGLAVEHVSLRREKFHRKERAARVAGTAWSGTATHRYRSFRIDVWARAVAQTVCCGIVPGAAYNPVLLNHRQRRFFAVPAGSVRESRCLPVRASVLSSASVRRACTAWPTTNGGIPRILACWCARTG
ncbi:hypothetical protein CO2235_90195 [Cupriavidus oxalaticus]|uniref:Uncharacterized protein n=1 Tax=Cupriavidus oxalaticus TaxID=96344 RepID=A0A976BFN4_9BURK|nr:hypothetical protein CO2235_90195 [Cupriavidus oxalaticus]